MLDVSFQDSAGIPVGPVHLHDCFREDLPGAVEGGENPLWYNWGPRVAGTFDIRGDGKTVAKVSWGRYLDQINTGSPPNPNANINLFP